MPFGQWAQPIYSHTSSGFVREFYVTRLCSSNVMRTRQGRIPQSIVLTMILKLVSLLQDHQ